MPATRLPSAFLTTILSQGGSTGAERAELAAAAWMLTALDSRPCSSVCRSYALAQVPVPLEAAVSFWVIWGWYHLPPLEDADP